jgi:hypothetical protein
MPERVKVAVSERALFARIDRALRKEGETLRRCRPDSRSYYELGDYYVIDVSINGVVSKDVDLGRMAKSLGLLKAYERLATDDE